MNLIAIDKAGLVVTGICNISWISLWSIRLLKFSISEVGQVLLICGSGGKWLDGLSRGDEAKGWTTNKVMTTIMCMMVMILNFMAWRVCPPPITWTGV